VFSNVFCLWVARSTSPIHPQLLLFSRCKARCCLDDGLTHNDSIFLRVPSLSKLWGLVNHSCWRREIMRKMNFQILVQIFCGAVVFWLGLCIAVGSQLRCKTVSRTFSRTKPTKKVLIKPDLLGKFASCRCSVFLMPLDPMWAKHAVKTVSSAMCVNKLRVCCGACLNIDWQSTNDFQLILVF